jgi:hypothetical protein
MKKKKNWFKKFSTHIYAGNLLLKYPFTMSLTPSTSVGSIHTHISSVKIKHGDCYTWEANINDTLLWFHRVGAVARDWFLQSVCVCV